MFTEGKVRIELNNDNDKSDFSEVFSFNHTIKKGRKKKKGNISRASDYFIVWLEEKIQNFSYQEIVWSCEVIMKCFYFAFVEIGKDEDVQELFTALNSTGLNLSIGDLLKSLLIKEIAKKAQKEKEKNEIRKNIRMKWEDEIVGVISSARNRQTINKDIEKFLADFWLARFGQGGHISKTKKIDIVSKRYLYKLFEYRIENGTEEETAEKIFEVLIKYAEVYKYIKDPELWWWKKSLWPLDKFFYTVNEISMLSFTQLFPIILKLYFDFGDKKSEEKERLTNELETLLLFVFRWTTIKDKSPGDTPKVTLLLLEEMAKEEKESLLSKDLKEKWLEKEFIGEEHESFYNSLKNYKTNKGAIWVFIFKRYYPKKYLEKAKKRSEEAGLKKGLLDLVKIVETWKQTIFKEENKWTAEHMVSQNLSSKEYVYMKEIEKEQLLDSLGNITLLKQKINSKAKNKPWSDKRDEVRDKCFLELEEINFLDLEELGAEEIKERTIMDLNNSYEKLKTEKEEQIKSLKQIQEEAKSILSKEVVVIQIPSEENSLLAYCRVIVEKIRDLEKDKQKLSTWKEGKVAVYRNFATPRQLNPEDLETRKHGVVMISALRKYKNILLMDQGPWTEEKLAEHQSKLEICQQILVTFEANLELEEEGYW